MSIAEDSVQAPRYVWSDVHLNVAIPSDMKLIKTPISHGI